MGSKGICSRLLGVATILLHRSIWEEAMMKELTCGLLVSLFSR